MQALHDDPDALDRALRSVLDYRETVNDLPVEPPSGDAFRIRLAERYRFCEGLPLEEVVADVSEMLREGLVHTSSRRYLGLFNPQALWPAVVADMMVAGFNPQLAAWSHAPAANEIEQHTLRTFLSLAGYDPSRSYGTFATGGGEANLSALVVALTHAYPEYGAAGLRGLPGQPVLYLSEQAHHSLLKAAHATGLGRDAVRPAGTDAQGRIDPEALARLVRADRDAGLLPFMVGATAGATATGVIDPLEELAEVCRTERLWLHVDAAWGGGALLSPKLRPLLCGIERADSITWDAHKWLSVSMGAGMFLCRHPEAVAQAFRATAHYMPGVTLDRPDPYTHSIQWSRRFTGLKVFMSLAAVGLDGYARLVEAQAALGELLRSLLLENGWTVRNTTPLPVLCFTHTKLKGRPDGARLLIDALKAQQPSWWLSEVRLSGQEPLVRACITNYRTSPDDLRTLIPALNNALETSTADR